MEVVVITGASGLIGSEAVSFFKDKFDLIVGVDNNLRSYFFGKDASTEETKKNIIETVENYKHYDTDIRDLEKLENVFAEYGASIRLIIHTAAQPSHDWAAKEPFTDFGVNAMGTLNMLELTRKYCAEATFIFTSTNKVYGDRPNSLPLIATDKRWEIDEKHAYFAKGIDENMSIDNSKHSIFGASKVAADILVQEYGKYFGMNTGVFRGGCLTGPNHAGTQLHGFLSYLVKCAVEDKEYTIFGYGGKQVRDNIHSYDLVNMFYHYHLNPRQGEVYNAGGGRHANCSILEAIDIIEEVCGKRLNYQVSDENRIGDHIWWISDVTKFKAHYPQWDYKYSITDIISQIIARFSR